MTPLRRASTLLALALGAQASAQSQPTHELKARVLHSGKPLADATVTFFPAPWLGLPFDLEPLRRPKVVARTDASGLVQMTVREAAGALLVEHAGRLGAFLPEIASGVTRRIEAQPYGALASASPEVDLDLEVAAVLPNGMLAPLGPRRGNSIELPAGLYRVLGTVRDRLLEAPATIASAQSTLLPAAEPELAIDASAVTDGTLLLPGWGQPLPRASNGHVRVPGTSGLRRVLLARTSGRASVREELLLDASSARPYRLTAAPPATRAVTVVDPRDRPVAGALVVTLRFVGEAARTVSWSLSGADGTASAGVPETAERAALLVVADGFALWHAPLSAESASTIRLGPGVAVRVSVVDESGARAPGALVQLAPVSAPWLARRLPCDARGEASFPMCAHERQQVALDDAGLASPVVLEAGELRARLEAQPGLSLQGQVVAADGKPLARVLVTLRDTTGAGGVASRQAESDQNGMFRFTGLPDRLFLLSASREAGGLTYSGQLPGAQPGPNEWVLMLRSEDLPPPAKR